MENIIALVGNPNTGKTTFFNSLTKSNEHVGNWHGVTVDIKEKQVKINNEEVKICDLPGLYSLTNYSYEEEVAKQYLYNKDCKIINICDANNLARNLYLTLQLLEMGKDVVLCVNMKKEFTKSGRILEIEQLKKILKIPVFFIDANNKKEVIEVVKYCLNKNEKQTFEPTYFNSLPINEVMCMIKTHKENFSKIKENFLAIKLLEQDEFIYEKLKVSNENKEKLLKITQKFGYEEVCKLRYEYIDTISKKIIKNKKNVTYGYSKLDKILLNKYLCFPCFLLILCLIFFLTFSSIGQLLTDGLSFLLDKFLATPLINLVNNATTNVFIISFVTDAIVGGLMAVVSFLPQIVLLFFFLNLLEESGYMSRLAFTLEDFFAKIGLSGKSVFTLLMGFGCSTTASLTSRNLEDKNSKIKTAILTPYLSCSAKLPIYSTICGAFFSGHSTLIIFSLYLLGVIVAVLISLILEKTILPSGTQSFILEFPPYRLPNFKKVIANILTNIKQFLIRVGGLMLCFTVVIWIMQNCNFKFQFGVEDTILKSIGEFFAPLFAPLGFGSWGAVCSLLCGIVAKEIIISTIGVINNVGSNTALTIGESLLITTSAIYFTNASALSYLIFSLLYFPCISTISVFAKEIGFKWTLIACLIQLSVAYLISFATYKIYLYFSNSGVLAGIISLLIFVIICISVLLIKKYFKKREKCKFCLSKCNNFGECNKN